MTTNRFWAGLGAGIFAVVGFAADAHAACFNSSQCPADAPICGLGTCKPCVTNLGCLLAGAGLFCEQSGPKAGQCTNGPADAGTGGSADAGVTLPTSQCQSDADCGAESSGLICASSNHQCIAGCRLGAGNHCGLGLSCSILGLDLGVCVVGGVDGGGILNPGCNNDGECGSATSGIVCDSFSRSCVAGCRASGNGCTAGLECSGIVGGIGICLSPAPVPGTGDAGAPSTEKKPGSKVEWREHSEWTVSAGQSSSATPGADDPSATATSPAAPSASDDVVVEGGGCNIGGTASANFSLFGLAIGAVAALRRRRSAR